MAHGDAIIVVEAIASWGAAPIAIKTTGNLDISAKSIAGGSRTVQGVGRTTVGVIAGGGAIPIADFVFFDHTVTATGAAVGIVIIIASAWAAPIAVCASGNRSENTTCIAIPQTPAQRIRSAGKPIVTGGRTIAIADFSGLNDIIRAEWSAIIVVKTIAFGRTTSISGSTSENGGV